MVNEESETSKFVDVLLVVMGLVLAGGISDTDNTWQGAIFYFGLFVFLTTAVGLRTVMTTSKGSKSIISSLPRGLYSLMISLSFPSVLASYFYFKLKPYMFKYPKVYWIFLVLDVVITFSIFMALYQTLKEDNR